TRGAGKCGPGICRGGVDRVVAGQLHRPAVVIELPREEEGVGETVALSPGVAVVLVGGDGVQPEAAVGRRIDRQRVVMTHHDRFTVARHEQLGRQRTIKGPEGLVVLYGHQRMKIDRAPLSGRHEVPLRERHWLWRNHGAEDRVIEASGTELAYLVAVQLFAVAESAVHAGSSLGGLEEDLGKELVPALVGPPLSRRTP